MAKQTVCKQCGQPIQGRYITALGASWHPEHFVCAGCGKPITEANFNLHNGAPYHSACFLDKVAPRCTYCGKPLEDSYQEYNGKPYHAVCLREHVVPRCAYCHEPLSGQYQLHDGIPYHTTCYRDHLAPRCAYCGKPLVNGYLEDQWGTKFCKEHQGKYPNCAYCGRLVPPRQQENGAAGQGIIRCPVCRATAIETAEQARPIFTSLKGWLNKQGLIYNNLPLSLELCDRAKLATLLKNRAGKDPLGVTLSTTHTLNGRETRSEVNGIAVLQGLPSTLFQGVTIHEMGHAWLVVQGIKSLPSWAEEGFCELLSHRYYSEIASAESRYRAANIEKNSDKIYGEGFRRVNALAERMGFQKFIETMRAEKRLPSR